MQSVIEENKKNAYINRKTVQPKIYIQEKLYLAKIFYVVFNDMISTFDTFFEALISCYQIYILFNLRYADECNEIWQFIQTYFFNATFDDEPIKNNVQKFISTIKNC